MYTSIIVNAIVISPVVTVKIGDVTMKSSVQTQNRRIDNF